MYPPYPAQHEGLEGLQREHRGKSPHFRGFYIPAGKALPRSLQFPSTFLALLPAMHYDFYIPRDIPCGVKILEIIMTQPKSSASFEGVYHQLLTVLAAEEQDRFELEFETKKEADRFRLRWYAFQRALEREASNSHEFTLLQAVMRSKHYTVAISPSALTQAKLTFTHHRVQFGKVTEQLIKLLPLAGAMPPVLPVQSNSLDAQDNLIAQLLNPSA